MPAPVNGEHYVSNYQLHTEDDKKFGEIVTLEFKLDAKCKQNTSIKDSKDSKDLE